MILRYSSTKASILFTLFLSASFSVHGSELQCSIKNVTQLNDAGSFVTHGWSANYLNREFTVESATGKVLRTTALKQRLSNFDKEHAPILLGNGDGHDSIKAVTLYEQKGQFALLEIRNITSSNPMPFFYHTEIGMILTGTCQEAI